MLKQWIIALAVCANLSAAPAPDADGFSEILKNYVQAGRVDYDAIRRERRPQLEQYVASLGEARPDLMTHGDQVAFWLNAYNALIIQLVVDGGKPTDSFSSVRFRVAGEERTLDDIEHRALRPLAKDPRVHFALVCGAKSCPPLRARAFLSSDLNATLENAAVEFINDPNNVVLDRSRRTLVLSPIFDWYADDFGDVKAYIARYRSLPEDRQTLTQDDWKVEFRDYDWSINAQ